MTVEGLNLIIRQLKDAGDNVGQIRAVSELANYKTPNKRLPYEM